MGCRRSLYNLLISVQQSKQMANATIFNKTLTAGDSKAVCLEPGMELLRQTNLAANWLKIRIGIIASWTNLVDTNGTPNAETLVAVAANPRTSFNVGMSNGTSYFGTAGNRFVGIGSVRSSGNILLTQASSNWGVGNSAGSLSCLHTPMIGDGTTLAVGGSTAFTDTYRVNNPTAASSCLFGLCVQLDLSTGIDGRVTPTYYSTAGTPLSTASDIQMNNLLNAQSLSILGSANGGWWTMNGVTPVACPFVSIRNPWVTNRLNIHNLMIQQYL
jgi:hypothetical protein